MRMTTRRVSQGTRTQRRARLASRTALAGAATLLCGVFGVGAMALSSGPSAAATTATLFVDNVNGGATTGCSSAGSSACKTIQDAVTVADGLADTNVTLNVAGSSTPYADSVTINLPSSDTLDIEGTGSTLPTLDNGGTGSNVTISTTSTGAVTIGHMTISGGNASSGDDSGGAIDDRGSGTLSVNNDVFTHNQADGEGGAIDAADTCTGASASGNLVVTGSTFVDNSGVSLDGGAIDSADCSGTGTLTVTGSTFTGNDAGSSSGFGGAIAVWAAGTVTNSTFSANIAQRGAAVGGDTSSLALVDDTLTANAGSVSAIQNLGGFSVANSILNDAPATPECVSAITDNGHNVAADATCGLGSTSVSNSTTIGTLALAANGSSGPQTAAITRTSSAFGLVPLAACTVNTDERGQPRPGTGFTACDAGAYETQMSTGYDLAGSDGGVFVFPTGQPFGFFGSLPGLGIKVNNVVGLVPTNNFHGYDLAGSDGGVFVFPLGLPAGFFGSLPGLGVKVSNIVGLVPTNNDNGYDLVGRDGGVFVFPLGQSTGFFGSLPGLGIHVNNIVGIVATPGGGGYFLVGSDGGVFAFGNTNFFGSLPGKGISVNNIVAIATTTTGKGYYLVGSDGSVYPFGDAVDHGSLPAMHISVNNIVSIVPTADGNGYWLIGSDGGVFAFGDAGFIGSLPGLGVKVSNVVGAVPTLF
jgi:predicted outer membrane repeat protein